MFKSVNGLRMLDIMGELFHSSGAAAEKHLPSTVLDIMNFIIRV